jgi:hypothetical protein
MKRRYFVFLLILLGVFGFVMLLNYPLWLNRGTFQRTLDSKFIPTAEYLMAHPVPTPQFINSINPPIGGIINGSEEVCVGLLPGALTHVGDSSTDASINVAGSLRIIMNTQFVPSEAVQVEIINTLQRLSDGRFSGQVTSCFTPYLQKGLHIFQLEARNSPLGVFGFGELFSYTWAYDVQ